MSLTSLAFSDLMNQHKKLLLKLQVDSKDFTCRDGSQLSVPKQTVDVCLDPECGEYEEDGGYWYFEQYNSVALQKNLHGNLSIHTFYFNKTNAAASIAVGDIIVFEVPFFYGNSIENPQYVDLQFAVLELQDSAVA